LGAIWAIQAGKDVYLEKPVCHNVWEGRQIVVAARKHGRIVQTGTQSRSSNGIAEGIAFLREGHIGKLLRVRGLCYKRRASIGKVDGPQPIPPSVDYDLWCGPAPKDPLMRKQLHYDWHWVWPTGNGDLGNQGIHEMDVARWIAGVNELSPRILSVGGRLGYEDDGTTPNTLVVLHDYQPVPLFFEVRGLPEKKGVETMDKYRGAGVGVVAQYEHGYVVAPDYSNAAVFDNEDKLVRKYGKPPGVKDMVESNPIPESEKAEQKADEKAAGDKEEGHFANFISCVRSRNSANLNGKIIDGHISSGLCHTANISYRLGKNAAPDALREKFKGNKEALDSLNRLLTHLDANGVDVNVDQLTLGEFLKMDPKTEKFIDNAAADKLLTRDYRAPYVVPAQM